LCKPFFLNYSLLALFFSPSTLSDLSRSTLCSSLQKFYLISWLCLDIAPPYFVLTYKTDALADIFCISICLAGRLDTNQVFIFVYWIQVSVEWMLKLVILLWASEAIKEVCTCSVSINWCINQLAFGTFWMSYRHCV
jgi:hypothetical protein